MKGGRISSGDTKGKGKTGGRAAGPAPKQGALPEVGLGPKAIAKLVGTWEGNQNDTYEVAKEWSCLKKDGTGSSRQYHLSWSSKLEAILWGERFCLYASDLTSAGPARWYRCEDRQKTRCAFTWRRKHAGDEEPPTERRRPAATAAAPSTSGGKAGLGKGGKPAAPPSASVRSAPPPGRTAAAAPPLAAPTAARAGAGAKAAPSGRGGAAARSASASRMAQLACAAELAEAPFRELAARSIPGDADGAASAPAPQLPAPRDLHEDSQQGFAPEDCAAALSPAVGERPAGGSPELPGAQLLARLVGLWWGPGGRLYRVRDTWTCDQVGSSSAGEEEQDEMCSFDLAFHPASSHLLWGRAFAVAGADFASDDNRVQWRWQAGCREGRSGDLAFAWARHVEEGEQ